MFNDKTLLLLLFLGTLTTIYDGAEAHYIGRRSSIKATTVRPFSKKATAVYNAATSTDEVSAEHSGAPMDMIAASGKFIGDEVGYGSTPVHCQNVYYPAILSAKEEVVLTTFLYDSGSPCAKVANKALIDLNEKIRKSGGKKVRVNFLISTMSKFSFWKNPSNPTPGFSDFLHYLSETDPESFGFPAAEQIPNVEFRVKTYHKWPVGTIHNKLLVVDGKELAIGSKNWDQLPGYEYAARWRGSIAQSARRDFERIWEEPLPALSSDNDADDEGAVPMMYLSRVSNPWFTHPEDNPMDQAWIKALEVAEREVYIQSPNFTTETVVNKVLEAVKRGVKVKVVTAFSFHDVASYFNTKAVGNNKYTVKQMYEELSDQPKNIVDNLQVCYFLGKRVQPPKPRADEFAHVKFMSVDNEFYIFGSGNQDTQSWYNSSESNVLVDDAEDTKRVLERLLRDQQSFDHCYRDLDGEHDINDPNWKPDPSGPQEPPEPTDFFNWSPKKQTK